jgi:hypothetical protein
VPPTAPSDPPAPARAPPVTRKKIDNTGGQRLIMRKGFQIYTPIVGHPSAQHPPPSLTHRFWWRTKRLKYCWRCSSADLCRRNFTYWPHHTTAHHTSPGLNAAASCTESARHKKAWASAPRDSRRWTAPPELQKTCGSRPRPTRPLLESPFTCCGSRVTVDIRYSGTTEVYKSKSFRCHNSDIRP